MNLRQTREECMGETRNGDNVNMVPVNEILKKRFFFQLKKTKQRKMRHNGFFLCNDTGESLSPEYGKANERGKSEPRLGVTLEGIKLLPP